MSNASARLTRIAAELRATGDKANLAALRKGLKLGAAPLVPAVKDAARRQLPKTGGLNEHVAGQRITTSVRLSARSADVRLTTSAPDTLWTDSGYVRHPVFGRWLPGQPNQPIPAAAGWWTKTLQQKSAAVAPVLEAELEKIAARIRAL